MYFLNGYKLFWRHTDQLKINVVLIITGQKYNPVSVIFVLFLYFFIFFMEFQTNITI